MAKCKISLSSKSYSLHVEDLLLLEKATVYDESRRDVIILLGDVTRNVKDTLLSGASTLTHVLHRGDCFVDVKVAYEGFCPLKALALQFIKKMKKKSFQMGSHAYRIKLSSLLACKVHKKIVTRENAYTLASLRRQGCSKLDSEQMYHSLLESMRINGYDYAQPLSIGLNQKNGRNDRLSDGHHRLGICLELDVDQVSVKFKAYPSIVNRISAIDGSIIEKNVIQL